MYRQIFIILSLTDFQGISKCICDRNFYFKLVRCYTILQNVETLTYCFLPLPFHFSLPFIYSIIHFSRSVSPKAVSLFRLDVILGRWTRVSQQTVCKTGYIWALPGKYDWTIRARRWGVFSTRIVSSILWSGEWENVEFYTSATSDGWHVALSQHLQSYSCFYRATPC